MKRRLAAILITLMLVLSMSVTVFAEPGAGRPVPPGSPIAMSIPLELSEAPSDSYSDSYSDDTIADTNMANIVE